MPFDTFSCRFVTENLCIPVGKLKGELLVVKSKLLNEQVISYECISDNRLNTHTTKEDTLNRHNKPLTLACMFGDFGTWQCSHKVRI